MACPQCTELDGALLFPIRGEAPKYRRENWPEHFVEDSNGYGRYFCRSCRAGLDSAKEVRTAIKKISSEENRKASHRRLERKAADLNMKEKRRNSIGVSSEIKPPESNTKVTSIEPSNSPIESIGCVPWLIGVASYCAFTAWVWAQSVVIGRLMLMAFPILCIISAAYYFAEGSNKKSKSENFVSNLQKIAICLFVFWLLTKCSAGPGDGPIDLYFRK